MVSTHNKVGDPYPGVPHLNNKRSASASRAFCSSGVSLAMPMPVAVHTRAKKMAIQFENAQGMLARVATSRVPAM